MIFANEPQDGRAVAAHYDSLDPWYLKLWGEHLHHGFWTKGNESPERAVVQLVELLAERAALEHGAKVCDIGCGYGAPARLFSSQWGADITAFTLSQKQHAYAQSKDPLSTYILGDWFDNSLSSDTFDATFAIESSDHMTDKAKFFREMYRVLKPNGRMAVSAWLSKENPKEWEKKWLLEPICREGRMPSLGSPIDYLQFMKDAGFTDPKFEDISHQVKKTWSICAFRFLKALGTREFRHFLFKEKVPDRIFAKSLFRILAAYQTKSLVYGVFSAVKPPS
jgi:tocopherol O-methyltransferase